MPLKESSEKMKESMKAIKDDVRGVIGSLTESAPRPIMERISGRQPLILREPLVKTLRERRKKPA